MQTIWKFELSTTEEKQIINMPIRAKILTIQTKKDIPYLFALVESKAPIESRKFVVVNTGTPCKIKNEKFIGSFPLYRGSVVWHLFEDLS
jgi:hypothetical protein